MRIFTAGFIVYIYSLCMRCVLLSARLRHVTYSNLISGFLLELPVAISCLRNMADTSLNILSFKQTLLFLIAAGCN